MMWTFNEADSDCSSSIDSDEALYIIKNEGREVAHASSEINFLNGLCRRAGRANRYNSKPICSSKTKLNVYNY